MCRQAAVLFVLCWTTNFVFSKSESNIQKVNNRKMSELNANMSNLNEQKKVYRTNVLSNGSHGMKSDYERNDKHLLLTLSKNNPELDWKTVINSFTSNFQNEEDIDIDFMTEDLGKTMNSIQWLTDLYDPLRWRKIPGNVHESCKADMELFLESLKKGNIWAAKSKCEFILRN